MLATALVLALSCCRDCEAYQARLEALSVSGTPGPYDPVTIRFRVTNLGADDLPGVPIDEVGTGRPGTWIGWVPAASPHDPVPGFEERVLLRDRPLRPGDSAELKLRVQLRNTRKAKWYQFVVYVGGLERPGSPVQIAGDPWGLEMPAEPPPIPERVRRVRGLLWGGVAAVLGLATLAAWSVRRAPRPILFWGLVAAAAALAPRLLQLISG